MGRGINREIDQSNSCVVVAVSCWWIVSTRPQASVSQVFPFLHLHTFFPLRCYVKVNKWTVRIFFFKKLHKSTKLWPLWNEHNLHFILQGETKGLAGNSLRSTTKLTLPLAFYQSSDPRHLQFFRGNWLPWPHIPEERTICASFSCVCTGDFLLSWPRDKELQSEPVLV